MKRLILILTIITTCLYANPDGYKIETVKTPRDVLFHITGLDLAKDGRLFCATRYGEVWILNKDKWTRFAKGLQEPCGLVVDKDGSVILTQKPGLRATTKAIHYH